jgi:hypothetical protein
MKTNEVIKSSKNIWKQCVLFSDWSSSFWRCCVYIPCLNIESGICVYLHCASDLEVKQSTRSSRPSPKCRLSIVSILPVELKIYSLVIPRNRPVLIKSCTNKCGCQKRYTVLCIAPCSWFTDCSDADFATLVRAKCGKRRSSENRSLLSCVYFH